MGAAIVSSTARNKMHLENRPDVISTKIWSILLSLSLIFLSFYASRRKLYARAAASHTWTALVIIPQECVIDLNRERVGPAAG